MATSSPNEVVVDSILADFSGRVQIDSEDPRWIQLLSHSNITRIITLKDGILNNHCKLLVQNNPITGNFVQLLRQTSARLLVVVRSKAQPNGQTIDQCCVSLYLALLVFHFLVTNLTPHQVQCFNIL